MIKTVVRVKKVNFDIESHNLILTKEEEKEIFDFGIRELNRRILECKTKGNLKMIFFRGKKCYDLYGTWEFKEVFI